MSDGTVHLTLDAGIAWIVFDRPQARNAMTWTMYNQLAAICEQLKADPSVRVAVFRGELPLENKGGYARFPTSRADRSSWRWRGSRRHRASAGEHAPSCPTRR